MPDLPAARGATSEALLAALVRPPHPLAPVPLPQAGDPLHDEDLQLALYCCYELHYRGLPGVDEDWEWEPSLLALRRDLEALFETGLHALAGAPSPEAVPAEEIDVALRAIAE